jgi:hypothetical protein
MNPVAGFEPDLHRLNAHPDPKHCSTLTEHQQKEVEFLVGHKLTSAQ